MFRIPAVPLDGDPKGGLRRKRNLAVAVPFELHLEQGTLSGRADVILGEAAQITADLVQVEPRVLARAKPGG